MTPLNIKQGQKVRVLCKLPMVSSDDFLESGEILERLHHNLDSKKHLCFNRVSRGWIVMLDIDCLGKEFCRFICPARIEG